MRVELTRVRVKPGKSGRVDEWLAMLNGRMDEVKETLVREELHVEVIFREISGEDEFLYLSLIHISSICGTTPLIGAARSAPTSPPRSGTRGSPPTRR